MKMLNDIDMNTQNNNIPTNGIKVDDNFVNDLKEYNKKMSILNQEDYREKVDKLYKSLGNIKPIDNEINDIIYFNNYEENGIVINETPTFLKQTWTEYRLIYNEKTDTSILENSFVLDNFDALYDNLSQKIVGVGNYIEELNIMKREASDETLRLRISRENFELEKMEFDSYRKSEIERLENKEKDLNEKMNKVNTLIESLNEKIGTIIN